MKSVENKTFKDLFKKYLLISLVKLSANNGGKYLNCTLHPSDFKV